MADEHGSGQCAAAAEGRPVPLGQPAAQSPACIHDPAPLARRRAAPAPLDEQATVISKRPPVSEPALQRAASPFEMGTLLEGKRLGHFLLEQFVGGGGMGAVFRAVDTMLGRTVAVKVLSREQNEEETLRRFKNEAQSAARLDHENIARVHYVGEDNGWNYIVFEFIDGVNIRELVERKGPLPLDEAISYTLQVAEALDHASRRDVIHRDIKPSNVLVTADGRAKLVDMGLARLYQVDSSGEDLTATGVTLGTFDYISPEQARDPRNTDVRSDLYSLGCTLYYMLTGSPPFPDGTVLQKLLSHTSDQPPDPRLYRPELCEEVAAILNKMLAKDPANRYQEPRELIGQLCLLGDQLDLPCVRRFATVRVAPRETAYWFFERHLPWAAPALALVALVFALDLFSPPRGTTHPSPLRFNSPGGQLVSTSPSPQSPSDDLAAPDWPAQLHARSRARAGDDQLGASPNPDAGSRLPEDSAVSAAPSAAHLDGPNAEKSSAEEQPALGGGAGPSQFAAPAPGSAASAEPSAAKVQAAAGAVEPAGAAAQQGGASTGEPPRQAAADAAILVVDPSGGLPPSEARVATSLAAACRVATELPTVEAVELRFSGELVEQPFDVAPRKLTIRAGRGFQPAIVFRPEVRDAADRRRMIDVVGGELAWQSVHLRLELPADRADDSALFHLDHVARLEMEDCTLSICRPAGGGPLQTRLAFVEMTAAPGAPEAAGGGEQDAVSAPPLIKLSRCIARGCATLIRADEAVPLRLMWEQGLFVTTQRLIETGGAIMKPRSWDGRIDLALRNVTASVPRGLCLTTIDELAPYQLELVTRCRDCIILTEPSAALIEQVGAAAEEDLHRRPNVCGADNFYPSTNTILRIDPTGDPAAMREYAFDRRDEAREEQWYEETRAQSLVLWRAPPPANLPVHLHAKEHYLLDNSPTNPALHAGETLSAAGFDPRLLPEVPDTTFVRATKRDAAPPSPGATAPRVSGD